MTNDFQPVHDQVIQWADKVPDRIAIRSSTAEHTYGDMIARSRAVSELLAGRGMQPGCVVPIITADPVEAIFAMLGCWAVGTVPAPLDPSSPREQLLHRLFAISPEWIVSGALPEGLDQMLEDRYSVPDRIRLPADVSIEPAVHASLTQPDDPAYVFFTSGSTGSPKGIVGRHRAIDHFLRWERELTGACEGVRVSMLTNPSFDAVLRDVFLPLTSGGTVCVPSQAVLADPAALMRWLAAERVNVVHCVPSVFNTMVTAARSLQAGLDELQWILLAGEVLRPESVARWQELYGTRVQLVNLYGPSETTMTKTFHLVDEQDGRRHRVPIGRPMPGARVVLLDESLQPVPDGAVGEIVIRTPYMSLGYYNAPAETRARFIPNPLGDDPDDFVYRTGDYARLLPDGELEFLGRKDRQVQVGGVRLELDEVESVISALDGVQEVAVQHIEPEQGEAYLCAYVVGEAELDVARERLAGTLPAGAIPGLIVPMAELPRTISGKIDRTALPEPALERSGATVAPRTPTEELVLDLWRRVLPAAADLGVTDDFFAMGGHSLLVMRLTALIQDELGVEVTLADFLQDPTVAHIATLVESQLVADLESDDVLLRELLDEPTSSARTDG